MKWYNRWIFDKFGHRRLMTREEFVQQLKAEVQHGDLRVIERRDHVLLLEIVVHANAILQLWTQKPPVELATRHDLTKQVVERLQKPIMVYKMREQDRVANTPHSTNRMREVKLMDFS